VIVAPSTIVSVEKSAIRSHYDLATPFYRLLWGPHIHHGLWSEEDAARPVPLASTREAQEHLTDTLASLGRLTARDRVLDVGCGMGGSSIRLARTLGCHVTGITLSGVQQRWAAMAARLCGVARRVSIRRADAESVVFPPRSFDVVWSIECTEHLFDKPAFFRRAAGWLRPGGRISIGVWLAAEDADRPGPRSQVERVCDAFLCPSLGTFSDYVSWMQGAGLEVVQTLDWTPRVARTWELCDSRVRRLGLHRVAPYIDRRQAAFLDHFATLLEAYRSGAMQYGAIVARLPGGDA
jgi:tocopherol O-methyltransferase